MGMWSLETSKPCLRNKQWCYIACPCYPPLSDPHTSAVWQKWPQWNLLQPQLCFYVAKALEMLACIWSILALIPNTHTCTCSWDTFCPLFAFYDHNILLCVKTPQTIFGLESSVNWGLGVPMYMCFIVWKWDSVEGKPDFLQTPLVFKDMPDWLWKANVLDSWLTPHYDETTTCL